MKVCVAPIPSSLSRAMHRVAKALAHFAPKGIEIVSDPSRADVQVLHVISPGSIERWLSTDRYAVIQYCCSAEAGSDGVNVLTKPGAYTKLWNAAILIWSYLDLSGLAGNTPFYLSPLGVDPVFSPSNNHTPVRDIGVITTGYIDGPGAEAIQDVATAAELCGLSVIHIGPRILRYPSKSWSNMEGITDRELVKLYRRAKWVSGLRHIEGFELPVIEGIVCGARPMVFERPDMRRWYSEFARFVPESSGDKLVSSLVDVFRSYEYVSLVEQRIATARFNWSYIAKGFWDQFKVAA